MRGFIPYAMLYSVEGEFANAASPGLDQILTRYGLIADKILNSAKFSIFFWRLVSVASVSPPAPARRWT